MPPASDSGNKSGKPAPHYWKHHRFLPIGKAGADVPPLSSPEQNGKASAPGLKFCARHLLSTDFFQRKRRFHLSENTSRRQTV